MKPIKLLLLLIICSMPIVSNAQLIPWKEDKPLTWDDFKGPPDMKGDGDAYTNCKITYHYLSKRRDSVYVVDFTFESGFDTKASWAFERSENEDLLKHEQLHFDLHELYVRKLVAALKSATYTSNFRQEISDIVTKQYEARRSAQIKYDQESEHSRNDIEQKIWENYVHTQLRAIPKNY